MFEHLIILGILCALTGIPIFIYVEQAAFNSDKSGIAGFLWGAAMAVLTASITAVIYLIVITR